MNTLVNEAKITSTALMSGVTTEVSVFPSSKHGIRFFLNGMQIDACLENVVSTEHCTVLAHSGAKVMLVEHFMAALAFCGIDSLDVCLNNFELPILDGSSREWVNFFKSAGIKPSAKKQYALKEPVFYQEGKSYVALFPSSEFSLTYAVNYNHPDLVNKWHSVKDDFDEVIEARTFGFLKDLETLQNAGFAKGVTIDNTLGLTDDGYTVPLRSENEPVKHKILDIIGDFNLTGINPLNLNATVFAKEAGHTIHVKCAKLLKDKVLELN